MRPKTTNKDLPPRMIRIRRRKWVGYYYSGYDTNGKRKQIPLGTDINEAKKLWAKLEGQKIPVGANLMRFVFDRYELEVLPTRAPRTQANNISRLRFLRRVFGEMHIDAVKPQHIKQYLDLRGKSGTVSANREISVFSHAYNKAREWGMTSKENPVRGVEKHKERPRDYYPTDEVWDAVFAHGVPSLQMAMNIAYRTGQRMGDVSKMRLSDIRDNALEITQNKTGKKLRIRLNADSGERTTFGKLIDESRAQAKKVSSVFIVSNKKGQPLGVQVIRRLFTEARTKAVLDAEAQGKKEFAAELRKFQFRDIRSKAASDTNTEHASKLLGHADMRITRRVYQRRGDIVLPLE